jgi:TetR/AcrR family transcriptional repressor of nem operon
MIDEYGDRRRHNFSAGRWHGQPMAGVKQFDRDAVLDRAMAVFWQRGYEATSIQDLVEATGIKRGSIYGTFGDKQGLFSAVLDHYADRVGKPLMRELSDPDPRRALARMLAAIIERTCDPSLPRGCLNTNTALECPTTGETINRQIVAGFGRQEKGIRAVLRKAQLGVLLDSRTDLRALARFFMAVCHGMNVVNKAIPDRKILLDISQVAMSIWDVPGPSTKSASKPRRRDDELIVRQSQK